LVIPPARGCRETLMEEHLACREAPQVG
jgi:hypothetical protein